MKSWRPEKRSDCRREYSSQVLYTFYLSHDLHTPRSTLYTLTNSLTKKNYDLKRHTQIVTLANQKLRILITEIALPCRCTGSHIGSATIVISVTLKLQGLSHVVLVRGKIVLRSACKVCREASKQLFPYFKSIFIWRSVISSLILCALPNIQW